MMVSIYCVYTLCSCQFTILLPPSPISDLQESNVKLRLMVVSTAGYGDQINKDNSCHAILDYINKQFERYLQEELKIKRELVTFHDTRIHLCLYFVSPTGHS